MATAVLQRGPHRIGPLLRAAAAGEHQRDRRRGDGDVDQHIGAHPLPSETVTVKLSVALALGQVGSDAMAGDGCGCVGEQPSAARLTAPAAAGWNEL